MSASPGRLRLEARKERLLERWREGSLPVLDASALSALLDGLANALGGMPSPGSSTVAERLGCGCSLSEGLGIVERLHEVALEELEEAAPLGGGERASVRRFFHTLRARLGGVADQRQRDLERALQASQERYLVAARAAGFAIWDWQWPEQAIAWSDNAPEVFGHPAGSLEHLQHWLEHVHPQDRDRVQDGLVRAVEEGRSQWSDAFSFLRRDGSWAGVLARSWILRGGSGDPVRVVGGMIDVSEQRRLERDLRAAVRVRDEFLSIASHELRTPLTALTIQVQGLTRGRKLESVQDGLRARLKNVERSVQRLAELVDDLLDVSRVSAGQLRLQPEPFDLTELAREVIDRMGPEIRRAGSTVFVAMKGPVKGTWDRSRADQVLSNLLSNALKYGLGKPVEVEVLEEGEEALLRVKDHGIGIRPEEQDRIFKRFERAVSDRHYGGFGLGLWIVRQILAAMGGSVRLKSDPGQGSTFEVRLPREPRPGQ